MKTSESVPSERLSVVVILSRSGAQAKDLAHALRSQILRCAQDDRGGGLEDIPPLSPLPPIGTFVPAHAPGGIGKIGPGLDILRRAPPRPGRPPTVPLGS